MLKVAIIGRPNVGKSTLFNRLVGRKLALVHDTPGVTRDRKESKAKLYDLEMIIIDTAGYEYSNQDTIEQRMWKQTKYAIDDADVCIFMFDARMGIQPYDDHFAGIVRESGKPVVLIGNKCEGKKQEDSIFEAYSLGLGDPIPFSAEHSIGIDLLYESLKKYDEKQEEFANFDDEFVQDDESQDEVEFSRPLNIAIVGRPNVGKSTLINALIENDRLLTGPEAGITRDSITIPWEYKGREVRLVDTAGLRRRSKVSADLEKMSAASTRHAAYMAQVVVLVLDANGVLDKQDLTIARNVIEEGRALVIAVNKWDIADKKEALEILNYKLRNSLAQVDGVPTVTISALKKKGFKSLMDAIFQVYEAWNTRIPTSPLNRWFSDMMEKYPAPLGKNSRRIKLKYITQAKTRPPSFYIFSSNPEGLPDSYLRYMINGLRETFNMQGVPIRMVVRKGDNPYADKKQLTKN